MGSSRLPGKVLADICGAPLLGWLLERIQRSDLIRDVVVATTTSPSDDAIEALCREMGVGVFRGDETDVLRRMVDAAHSVDAGVVVRISADSPLIGPDVLDVVLAAFSGDDGEIVQNHRPAQWPVGTAVEAMTTTTLEQIESLATTPDHREHVTLYAYEHPDEFRISFVPPPPGCAAPDLRLCVDTAEDLESVRAICETFAPDRQFGIREVIQR